MERRSRSNSGGVGGIIGRRGTLEEVAQRFVHSGHSHAGRSGLDRGHGHRSRGSAVASNGRSSAEPASVSVAAAPASLFGEHRSVLHSHAAGDSSGRFSPDVSVPRLSEQASTPSEARRTRLRDGGAAMLSPAGLRMRPSPSQSSSSTIANALESSHGVVHRPQSTASSTGELAVGDSPSGPSAVVPSFPRNGRSTEQASTSSVDAGLDGMEANIAPLERERARERELRARVQGLQRQLEGLQLASATLQAVVSPLAGRDAATPGSQDGSSRGRTADRQSEPVEVSEDDEDREVHPHVTCDGCGAGPPIFGQVMTCLDCDDFDFCARCFQDRDQLGHPSDHRFRRRTVGALDHSTAAIPLMRGGGPAGILLRLLEAELLYEALRQSADPDEVAEETQEEKEMRSVEVLSVLPRIRYAPSLERPDEDGSTPPECEECALCLDEYSRGEEVLKLPCRHLFHEGCLGPWFVKSLTCPLCKHEVSAEAE